MAKKKKNELILPASLPDMPEPLSAEPILEPPVLIETPVEQRFDGWFAKIQPLLKINPDLKSSIRAHFKRYGFWDNAQFDKGLEHFGLKLNLF